MAISGESDYIYGFHDPGNWRWILTDKGRTGWVLVTEEIGHDPGSHSAPDYREWSDAGFGVIIRLNNGARSRTAATTTTSRSAARITSPTPRARTSGSSATR